MSPIWLSLSLLVSGGCSCSPQFHGMIFLGADSGTDMLCEKCTILDFVGSAKPRWNFTKKSKQHTILTVLKSVLKLEKVLVMCTPLKTNIDTQNGHFSKEPPFPNHLFGYPC